MDRRIRELVLLGAAALAAVAIALAVAISVRQPRLIVALAVIAGVTAVIALMLNPRLDLTVAFLGLYLGLLDGPVRLGLGGAGGSEGVSAARDVLILAVALGAILRLAAKKEKLRLPPLSGWVLAFALLVLVEGFNPKTVGVLKALGGFRQQLEWVPFFFFGYALMRSKDRFRKFFLILGVITLANGIVATYQTQIGPAQLASWGPGYKSRVEGTLQEGGEGSLGPGVKKGARKFVNEGVAHVRPMGLGSDSGRSGGLGVIALPCALALLAIAPPRKRWVGVLLCLGALVGIAAGLGRLQVVGSLLAVLAFIGLAIIGGKKVSRPLAALLGVAALAIPLGVGFVTAAGSGTFSRYETLASLNPTGSCTDCKRGDLGLIPHQLSVAPFGVGLGTVGAASGFGGRVTDLIEGHGVGAETQYNFLADELGAPGLVLWAAFVLTLILLAARRLRRIPDSELRICLAGMFAPLIAIVLMGFSGPISTSGALGPYLWFTAGVCAYWFAGPMRAGGRERAVVAL